MRLWGQDHVDVWSCDRCGFGYAVPFLGGDAEFYALAHEGDPHYPDDRWEFAETLEALAGLPPPGRVAEIGAGHGAFLNRLRTQYPHSDVVAADFDRGAVAALRARGYQAHLGSLDDVKAHGPFDVVCMFQTVEHMADVDAVLSDLVGMLSPSGSVFVSMPNADATRVQEELTGYWDMPPNHVGRWTPEAVRRAADRHGFDAVIALQPVRPWETTWQLAVSSVNARAYSGATIESRINGIRWRPTRGALKRIAAVTHVPRLTLARARYRPLSLWAHLRRR
jgi:SAM-dependent methyltransferase